MSLLRKAFLVLALLQPLGAVLADAETDRLKAENAKLRLELQTLRGTCAVAPASASPAASAVPALSAPPQSTAAAGANLNLALPSSAAPPPPPSLVPQPALPAVASPAPGAVAQGPDQTQVPAGYKLVPANTPEYHDPLSPPYDRAGCSEDLFRGPPPAAWNDADNWTGMQRGLGPQEVEALVGHEHFDVKTANGTEWQYGKCGKSVSARVEFDHGKVTSWQVPDL